MMRILWVFFFVASLFPIQIWPQPPMPFLSCFRAVERGFFNQVDLQNVLGLHVIGQGMWVPIINELKRRQTRVPGKVEAILRAMKPNPLLPPVDEKMAWQVLFRVLMEEFDATLINYEINRVDIEEMFAYLKYKQQLRFPRCHIVQDKKVLETQK